jgi:hypothetical protein
MAIGATMECLLFLLAAYVTDATERNLKPTVVMPG